MHVMLLSRECFLLGYGRSITNTFHPLTIYHHTQWPTNLLGTSLTNCQIQRVVLPVKVEGQDLVDPQHLQYYHYNVQDTPSNQRQPSKLLYTRIMELCNIYVPIKSYISIHVIILILISLLCTGLNTTVPT